MAQPHTYSLHQPSECLRKETDRGETLSFIEDNKSTFSLEYSKRTMSGSKSPLPTFLLLENDRKSNNLGPILRCAAAYGISTVIAIGYAQCSVQGSHGASKHVTIVAFPTVDQAIASIHENRSKISMTGILGGVPTIDQSTVVEVQEDFTAGIFQAVLPQISPKEGKTTKTTKLSFPVGSNWLEETKIHCFAICKSKHGLSSLLARHCDRFVHIPHRSMGGEFSNNTLLDLPACMSIVFHHYTTRAGYDERTFQGHKFELRSAQHGELEKQEERRNKRQEDKKRQYEEMGAVEAHDMATGLFDSAECGDY